MSNYDRDKRVYVRLGQLKQIHLQLSYSLFGQFTNKPHNTEGAAEFQLHFLPY